VGDWSCESVNAATTDFRSVASNGQLSLVEDASVSYTIVIIKTVSKQQPKKGDTVIFTMTVGR
jgi:hypothetical protein